MASAKKQTNSNKTKAARKRRTKVEMIRDGFAAFSLQPEVIK
jgi:hypothetical protein